MIRWAFIVLNWKYSFTKWKKYYNGYFDRIAYKYPVHSLERSQFTSLSKIDFDDIEFAC